MLYNDNITQTKTRRQNKLQASWCFTPSQPVQLQVMRISMCRSWWCTCERSSSWNLVRNKIEKVCCRFRLCRANVEGETVPDCGPMKEDLSPKVFPFVDGTQRVKLSEEEQSWQEGWYIYKVIGHSNRNLGLLSERKQWHKDVGQCDTGSVCGSVWHRISLWISVTQDLLVGLCDTGSVSGSEWHRISVCGSA